MKKKNPIFYCIIVLVFCQVFGLPLRVGAISDMQKNTIFSQCEKIKDNLKNVQKADAKARVYLGSYYEAILIKFITPLNVRLVENNLSTADFVENQNNFVSS